jgi:Flp pilus assembly CpaF family ATPase
LIRGAEAFELTRAANAGCGFCCTVHANSARDALNAIVNAALMAGENVTEHIVRKVFAATVDFVIHLDRDTVVAQGEGMRRQTMEILAVSPALTDDFTTEPIFVREALGKPLVWTGQLPSAAVVNRLEAAIGSQFSLRAICEGAVSPL